MINVLGLFGVRMYQNISFIREEITDVDYAIILTWTFLTSRLFNQFPCRLPICASSSLNLNFLHILSLHAGEEHKALVHRSLN